ncbi:MAG: helix-turn-helix domain-containing protein [Nitrosomonas sp.]|nr:helix-turn-helix domain-containing protein [Nitrosomonas sp.]
MNLKEYLTNIESASSLSGRLKVPNVSVSNWANGKRPIPIRWMPIIEKETNGKVSRKDLCPDNWQTLWPELAQSQKNSEEAA